jgi:hypothetical protein
MSQGSHEGYQRLRDYNELDEGNLMVGAGGLSGGQPLPMMPGHHHHPTASAASSPGRTSMPGVLGIPPVRPMAAASTTTSSTLSAAVGGARSHGSKARQKKGR